MSPLLTRYTMFPLLTSYTMSPCIRFHVQIPTQPIRSVDTSYMYLKRSHFVLPFRMYLKAFHFVLPSFQNNLFFTQKFWKMLIDNSHISQNRRDHEKRRERPKPVHRLMFIKCFRLNIFRKFLKKIRRDIQCRKC